MSKTSLTQNSLPPEAAKMISELGTRIAIARKRRRITMADMSDRMFVSRKTLSRLEKGDAGISIAVFVSALWVLGLEKDLLEVAAPERDKVGLFHDRRRLPKRVRPESKTTELDF